MAPVTQDPLVGNIIAGCRIEIRIAAGGMGTVYRARSNRLDRDVAVKILAATLAADAEYVERFFREARAASSLDHPNVVKVFDSGKDQDRYYIVMEYVRGRTLDDLIHEQGRLSLERATRIIRDVARGLEAAAAQGIVHRDIKPQNILMDFDGTPKITDFGLVRQGARATGLTMEGVFMGTPEYVSPEQADGAKVDHRGDLYSLGITYYQMLSGTYPFQGKTAMEMALARIKDEPRPIEHACPGVSPKAAAILRKLLQKDPAQRYQTATEMIRDLDAILTGQAPQAPMSDKKGSERIAIVSLDTKRRLRAGSFVLLLLLGVVCFFGLGALGSALLSPGFPTASGIIEPFKVRDGQFAFRIELAGAGILALAGAFYVFRREMTASGRRKWIAILVALGAACAYVAALFVDRPAADGTFGLIAATAKSMGAHFLSGPNLLFLAMTFAFVGAGTGWPDERGAGHRALARASFYASLFMAYAFAVEGNSLLAPLTGFPNHLEILIPLVTISLISFFFGIEMAVGYGHHGATKAIGILLVSAAEAGVFAFGIIGPRPQGTGWGFRDLIEPVHGIGPRFFSHGTPMVAGLFAIALAILVHQAGLRKYSRKAG